MPPRLTVFAIDFLQDLARSLRSQTDPSVVYSGLSSVLAHYDVVNWPLRYEGIIWRARKCKTADGFASVTDLIYPPPHQTPAGRLNEPHEPLLYAVFNKTTAIEEIEAMEGDYVHLVLLCQ